MGKAFPIFRPYLLLIGLPGTWGFFAPEPGPGTVLRYAVHDASGKTHLFKWGETLSRKDPNFFRWHTFHHRIFLEKEDYERSVALSLCRKHRNLNPKSVNFIFVRLLKLSPKAYLAGARPLDPDYVEPEEGEAVPCPQ